MSSVSETRRRCATGVAAFSPATSLRRCEEGAACARLSTAAKRPWPTVPSTSCGGMPVHSYSCQTVQITAKSFGKALAQPGPPHRVRLPTLGAALARRRRISWAARSTCNAWCRSSRRGVSSRCEGNPASGSLCSWARLGASSPCDARPLRRFAGWMVVAIRSCARSALWASRPCEPVFLRHPCGGCSSSLMMPVHSAGPPWRRSSASLACTWWWRCRHLVQPPPRRWQQA
mmetsp:Transcript_6175/g.14038  ORF Transcript_6175/g.14038 Transcript_6175/m.14038 type:complete len:231 (+) Transcript_6175:34-726(+)